MHAYQPPTPSLPSGRLVGRLWVLAAALMWSSCGLFVKLGAFDDWSESARGPLLAFWRAFFAALVLWPVVRRARWNVQLVPLNLCFAVMSVTYLTAMVRTTAANAVWLQATSPWWVFLLSVLLFREPVVRRDLIPLCFGVLGVGTILWFEVQGEDVLGVVCGLVSGVTFGSVLIFMRRLRAENPAWLITLCHSVVALVMVPWVMWIGVWPSLTQAGVLAAFGALQMAIPYLMMIRGLRYISSQEAVAIGLLEPTLLPLWVFLVGRETPAWWTILGAALILTGLALRYVVVEWWGRR